jgi:aspartyl-tRNA(Asn)/glutamyl-tRNA(Gln) amidotransferase subunit C
MAFQPDDIRRLARLARIGIDENEAQRFAGELSGIFGLIDRLQAVDTAGVEPLAHPLDAVMESAQRLREDAVAAGDERDANLANAPQAEHGLFLVPRVIE